MNKKTRNNLLIWSIIGILVLIGAVVGGIFLIPKFFQSGISDGEYIQSPVFMYYECSPAKEKVTGAWVSIPNKGAWYQCPDNSDECDIDLGLNTKSLVPHRVIYNICIKNSNSCEGNKIITSSADNWQLMKTLFNFRKDQTVFIEFQKAYIPFVWQSSDIGQVRANYKPFILWKVGMLSGGRTEYTTLQQGCVFPTTDTKNIIKNVINLILPHKDDSISTYKLEPYKTRNFIESFVPLSKENVNFVTYNGQTGYCIATGQSKNVYSIATVQTQSATYQIVDTNLNTILKPNVECCPNEKEPTRKCNNNFQWEQINEAQCSAFNPCAGIDYYPSGKPKELVRYECVSNQCVPRTKIVECTSDNDCIGNPKGKYCDTKIWQCSGIPDINQTVRENCNDGIDNDGNGLIDKADPYCKEVKDECGAWLELGGKTIIPDLWCKFNNFLETFKIYFAVIVGIFASIFGGLITRRFVKDLQPKPKYSLIIGIALLLGIATGFVAYIYFWVALILLTLFIVIKIFI